MADLNRAAIKDRLAAAGEGGYGSSAASDMFKHAYADIAALLDELERVERERDDVREDYEAASIGIDNDLIHANAKARHWYDQVCDASQRGAVAALRFLSQDLRKRGFESAATVADFYASNTETEWTL